MDVEWRREWGRASCSRGRIKGLELNVFLGAAQSWCDVPLLQLLTLILQQNQLSEDLQQL